MADNNMQLQWTDDQWNRVRQIVYEEARRARVAGNFLPLYGPLEPNAVFVPQQTIEAAFILPQVMQPQLLDQQQAIHPAQVLSVQDTQALQLSTLQVEVVLRGAQVADPGLESALIAFRRAANLLARLEDMIVFRGQPAASQLPPGAIGMVAGAPALPFQVRGGQMTDGLLGTPDALRQLVPQVLAAPRGRRRGIVAGPGNLGEALVDAVSGAIGQLENNFHLGPFACVLDHEYFHAVQTPNASLVLPQDRILPFLGGGALLRSSVLPAQTGLVIALGGAPIDLVVATDISVAFLQVTADPYFVFRVYEKIVLRIKQPEAIARLFRVEEE